MPEVAEVPLLSSTCIVGKLRRTGLSILNSICVNTRSASAHRMRGSLVRHQIDGVAATDDSDAAGLLALMDEELRNGRLDRHGGLIPRLGTCRIDLSSQPHSRPGPSSGRCLRLSLGFALALN